MTAGSATVILLDTNLLVYAHDRREREKQGHALAFLERTEDQAVVSTQVLAEFYWVATRRGLLTAAAAESVVAAIAGRWPVLPVTKAIVMEAIRGAARHGFSYWDAQLWATARLNQIETIASEDFSPGREAEGVVFLNPFSAGGHPSRD